MLLLLFFFCLAAASATNWNDSVGFLLIFLCSFIILLPFCKRTWFAHLMTIIHYTLDACIWNFMQFSNIGRKTTTHFFLSFRICTVCSVYCAVAIQVAASELDYYFTIQHFIALLSSHLHILMIMTRYFNWIIVKIRLVQSRLSLTQSAWTCLGHTSHICNTKIMICALCFFCFTL